MLDNNTYNLMKQIVQEHKSLWRIKENYISDAHEDDGIVAYWEALEKDKESHIRDLLELLKERLDDQK